jgi:cold-inducible RNA-binding protein
MARKLFVGGLSWNTTDEGLRAAFGRFGAVTEAKVVTDRETGRSRGFGFVAFQNQADAESAMQAMDGATLDTRQIRVSVAEDKPRGPRPDGPRPVDGGAPRAYGPGRSFDRGAPDSRSPAPRDGGFASRPAGPPPSREGRPPRNFEGGGGFDRGGRGFASAPPPPAEGRSRRDRDRDRGRDRDEGEGRVKRRGGRGRRRHEDGDGDLDMDY